MTTSEGDSSTSPSFGFWSRVASAFAYVPRTLRLVWEVSRNSLIVILGLTMAAAILPVCMALVGKKIIDAVMAAQQLPAGEANRMDGVIFWLVTEFVLVAGSALVERGITLLRVRQGAVLGAEIHSLVIRKALQLDISHFENPRFYDMLTRAKREASSRPLALAERSLLMLRNVVTLSGYVAVLLQFHPMASWALLCSSVPIFVSEAYFSQKEYLRQNSRSAQRRLLGYLDYVLGSDVHVKEVKFFGLGDLLLGRYRGLTASLTIDDFNFALKRSSWNLAVAVLSLIVFYGCYVLIARGAVTNSITIGEMALYVVAFSQSRTAIQSITFAINGMYEDNLYMSNLFGFLDIPVTRIPPRQITDKRNEQGIRFEDVGYRYPDADKWALRHVSVQIPPNGSVALVGENGAGKTTFLKIVLGFYTPTEGKVFLDGIDLREWPPDQLKARFTVLFQDFSRYQLPFRDNVGFGQLSKISDESQIERAVAAAGIEQLVAGMPRGFDTQLGRIFEGGKDLSGGEWQKIALARSLMAETADIVVLDEPTAALDPQAERRILNVYRELFRNRTAILISHRLPIARLANEILVMEGGSIVERGSHDELLKSKTKYSRLFDLQSEAYR